MKKIIGIIIGAAIVLFLALGIFRSRQTEEVQSIASVQQEQGVPVLTQKVQRHSVQQLRRLYGTIEARESALVSSKLMERIDRVLVDVGQQVSMGDELVRFDNSANPASVEQARLQLANAERDFERMKQLFEEGAISRQTLDQVKLGYEVAKENFQSASRTINLFAPIAGTVARVDFEAGQIAYPGDVVVQIVNEGAYQVRFEVSQEDRPIIEVGQDVLVRLRDSGEATRGTIRQINLSADLLTRLFTAYADLDSRGDVYPGMMTTVEVVIASEDDAVTVPAEALIERGSGSHVYVVDDGTAKLRKVVVGLRGSGMVAISEGLRAGDTIITYGMSKLEEGAKVKQVNELDGGQATLN